MKVLAAPASRSPRCHRVRDWFPVFLRLRVELDSQGIGIDVIQKNLNVK